MLIAKHLNEGGSARHKDVPPLQPKPDLLPPNITLRLWPEARVRTYPSHKSSNDAKHTTNNSKRVKNPICAAHNDTPHWILWPPQSQQCNFKQHILLDIKQSKSQLSKRCAPAPRRSCPHEPYPGLASNSRLPKPRALTNMNPNKSHPHPLATA